MNYNLRKLSTNDILVYDDRTNESFLLKSAAITQKKAADRDLLALARELVASGCGMRLSAPQLQQLKQATSHIEMLS